MKPQEHTIFIVDDSKIIIGLLENVISSMPNINVLTFESGESMLDRIPEVTPSLVFLDYYLNSVNREAISGEEALQQLKKRFSDVPVIMITGMSNNMKLEKLRSVGFDDVLHKDSDDIFNKVIECVKKYTRGPVH